MRLFWIALAVVVANGETIAAPKTLDELLDYVRQERKQEKQENREREKRFVAARERQQTMLTQAKQELAEEKARGDRLQQTYEQNEINIETQQRRLDEMAGSLGELEAVFSQMAGDTLGALKNSIVSAQHTQRLESSKDLAELEELPSPDDITTLWQLMLEEVVESGNVASFPATVITGDGVQAERSVTRIGVFNLVGDGRYLRFLPETGAIVEPGRQPASGHQKMIMELESATSDVVPVFVDPTRGTILALLRQAPDLVTRVRQGGAVGYVIIALGIVGLGIVLERLVVLSSLGRKVKRQMIDVKPDSKNPLGRILKVYQENPACDKETLGFKLDEAVLGEIPRLQRGLGTLSIVAAVAPLLGLLGTVIGIIETFQSITLFGTGDPRLMSGGISLALITTVMGLVVAIPLLLLHSVLTAKSNRIVQILDEKSIAMVASVAEQRNAV